MTDAAARVPEQHSRLANRYVLLEKLGAGGMGAVYRARDEATGQLVAFKQLLSSVAGSKRRLFETMFEREYQTLVRLKHPRVIEVYDYGLLESGPFYTMELLEDRDLKQLAPLPYKVACGHLRDVASLLALLHAHRLVHRDVSPRNVRLTKDGRAKLIDFGALQAFGVAADITGTPPCIAPEALRGMPLDQRTDLYALGAVGYWTLTGRHAFPARQLEDLPEMWQKLPPRPSQLVAEIPAALDTLIMSLLSPDPLSRPVSSAAVIDQLTVVGELPAEEHEHAAQSYLLSSRMVGRSEEQHWMEQRITRCLAGKGAEIVLEGPAGIGKTRLFHELGLQAQLKGVSVIKADAEAAPNPFGTVATLAVQLLTVCPQLASRLVAADIGLLAHLSPELRAKLGAPRLSVVAQNPAERRVVLQTALHRWFLEVARECPLLVAVDNVQAADDNSAAFLAALGSEARKTRLMVLATQRTGSEVTAPAPLRALRKRATLLKLTRLDAMACTELVRSLFGEVANSGRVARLLHQKSGGNPQQCMDLAQLLVKKKIAKYAAGTWVLPIEVLPNELPNRVEEIVEERLSGLSPAAVSLAEVISIHDSPVPFELCLSLSEAPTEAQTHEALDQLTAEQILRVDGHSCRFDQKSLREAVFARMDESHRQARHRRAAEVLLAAAGDNLSRQVQGAFHLFRAGEELRGAQLLASAGRRYLASSDVDESAEQVAEALNTALTVYEKYGRSRYEIAGLVLPLMSLAFHVDWQIIVQRGEGALQLGLDITGLALAQRLRKVLGSKLALLVGLCVAGVRFAFQRKRKLGYGLIDAIVMLSTSVPAVVGTSLICADAEAVERMRTQLLPFTMFGANQVPVFVYSFARDQARLASGRGAEVLADPHIREWLHRPKIRAAFGEDHWRSVFAAVLWTKGLISVQCFGDAALDMVRESESQGIRTWIMAADQVRLLYHAYRGESDQVRHYRERVELFAVQGSTTWQFEMSSLHHFLEVDILVADAVAARRTFEQYVRLARELPSFQRYAEAAEAVYLTLRGQHVESIARFENVMPRLPGRGCISWLALWACFASALNDAGQHARARQLMLEGLSLLLPEDQALVAEHLAARRQLALAEAGLGNFDGAVKMVDQLLRQYGHEQNPLLVGLLHKTGAEVALRMNEHVAFERHFAEMEQRFRSTHNPALVAQCDRLGERAVRSGLRAAADQAVASALGDAALLRREVSLTDYRTLNEISAAADPFEYALRLLLERARAQTGYLYKYDDQAMRLVATSGAQEPPPHVYVQLEQQAVQAMLEPQEDSLNVDTRISHPRADGRHESRSEVRSTSQEWRSRSGPAPAGARHRAEGRYEVGDSDPVTAHDVTVHEVALSDPGPAPAAISEARADRSEYEATAAGQNSMARSLGQTQYLVMLLQKRQERAVIVVGGFILEAERHHSARLAPGFLEAVAEAIHRRSTSAVQ